MMNIRHWALPGEEPFKKGLYIKLWVWHDACVQVEVIQPVIPVENRRTFLLHGKTVAQHAEDS